MNIGELAKRTGLTSSRIRFYESAGLLTAVDRRPNGYRVYPPEAVTVLDLITSAQRAGFTLDEIRKLLPSNLETWDHAALVGALEGKIADIEALEKQLRDSKRQLAGLLKDIVAKPDDIDCAANARRVLSNVLGVAEGELAISSGGASLRKKTSRRR